MESLYHWLTQYEWLNSSHPLVSLIIYISIALISVLIGTIGTLLVIVLLCAVVFASVYVIYFIGSHIGNKLININLLRKQINMLRSFRDKVDKFMAIYVVLYLGGGIWFVMGTFGLFEKPGYGCSSMFLIILIVSLAIPLMCMIFLTIFDIFFSKRAKI